MKTLIRPYDITLIYAAYIKSGKIQMDSLKERSCLQYKRSPLVRYTAPLSNKTIIEFGSRRV